MALLYREYYEYVLNIENIDYHRIIMACSARLQGYQNEANTNRLVVAQNETRDNPNYCNQG